MSLAEVMRRGLEYMTQVYPPLRASEAWFPPEPRHLGSFLSSPDEWRELANMPTYRANGNVKPCDYQKPN
jgi:hypothetical protein